MKKFLLSLIGLSLILTIGVVTYYRFRDNNDDNLTTIRLAEVTHSILYAPLYVAIENGYFEEEGIKIDLILTPGADRVTAAVLSNDVEIGFAGIEPTVYVYNGGEKNYLQAFAGIVKRDGQFIVSRQKIDNFKLSDMIGKEVLGGRVGGTPLINFENALKNEGVDPTRVNINTTIDFGALLGAFIGGQGDFVNLFEPLATNVENEGLGYVVASVGAFAGEVPYTNFFARKEFIDENEELLIRFTRAINRGLQFCKDNDAKTIAEVIVRQFPDSSITDLTQILQRNIDADSWLENPFITEQSYNNMLDMMIDANLTETRVPFKTVVRNLHQK